MEQGKKVKIGTSQTAIIASDVSSQSIRVEKMKINLSSPMPWVECSGELSTLSTGLYGISFLFDELGEFLYKIDFNGAIEYVKVEVVEITDNDIIKELLGEIKIKIDGLEQDERDDDIVFKDIMRYLKIINARL